MLEEENQILKLFCNLNGKNYRYVIEYDLNNNIVKVDNTDYYDFLENGELISDALVLDTELTNYFVKSGGSCE